jgi:hypothetical protein
MIRPSPNVVKALATVSRQYPELKEWLGEWRTLEVDRLPSVTQNVALAQGRCQVLVELTKLLNEAPDLAAERKQ